MKTTEGLVRAKAEGVKLGCPPALETAERVHALKEEGLSQSRVALVMGISARTVKRHWHA